MAIDPQAKIAKLKAAQELRAKSAQQKNKRSTKLHRNRGRVTKAEHAIVQSMVDQLPQTRAPLPAQVNAIAAAIGRKPSTVRSMIEIARDKFQSRAEEYVDKHMLAIDKALALGEVGEARKGAEFAIERLAGKDASGKSIRIIEKSSDDSSAPKINIGINLGGLGLRAGDDGQGEIIEGKLLMPRDLSAINSADDGSPTS